MADVPAEVGHKARASEPEWPITSCLSDWMQIRGKGNVDMYAR